MTLRQGAINGGFVRRLVWCGPWLASSNDTEQLGGHREDKCGLKAGHPAHLGSKGGEVGFRGEVATFGTRGGIGGIAHPFGDGFGLAALNAGRFVRAG